jgi:hypothetical protein
MRLRRRHVLIGAGATALAAAAAALGIPALAPDADRRHAAIARREIAATIDHYLPGSRLAEADLERFLTEFAALHPKLLRRGVRARLGQVRGKKAGRWRQAFDEKVMYDFLMSSDYYLRAPGERTVVRLIRPLDPYAAGCGNPMARFELG